MTTDPASTFDLIEATWFALRDNFDDALQATSTADERKQLLAERDGARDAYYLALGKQFDEQDEYIAKTKAELKKAAADMKKELQALENIAAVISAIAAAVRLAAALASMAIH